MAYSVFIFSIYLPYPFPFSRHSDVFYTLLDILHSHLISIPSYPLVLASSLLHFLLIHQPLYVYEACIAKCIPVLYLILIF